MMDPKTIALIGATDAEGTVGRTLVDNLTSSPNRKVYGVNPNHDAVCGVPCYPSIAEVPDEVDLAVVATPAATVPGVLQECADAGVHGAVVVSAGFAETGAEGLALENEIRTRLKGSKMRVLGPNSLGFLRPAVGLNASLLHHQPQPGSIALISQSAAIGTGMLDWATNAHVGFSFFTSMGGMIDVDFADLIDFLGEDRYTRSILIYMDNVGDAHRFMSAARGFARSKPIIVLKPGETAESARAALTHTGSWAGDDEVYGAAFKRAGVLRVHEIGDLFRAAEVLDSRRTPSGPNVAVITNAGGLGLMASAALKATDGRLAELAPETITALDGVMPAHWNRRNPIDLLANASGEQFGAAVKACLSDPEVNGIIVMSAPQANDDAEDMAHQVVVAMKGTHKPVISVLMGGQNVLSAREIFKAADIPWYTTPEAAVRAYMNMYEYTLNLELLYETPAELPIDVAPPKENLKAMIRRAVRDGHAMLTEAESKRLIATYGFPVVEEIAAHSVEEALEAAERIGYPVALKIVAPNLTHKSEIGGVALGVISAADLREAYARIINNALTNAPHTVTDGVVVERMVRKVDFELILGMKKDGQFGSVIVFGAGGVAAEGLADFSVSLPPLNETLARRMMEETQVYRRIQSSIGTVPPKSGQLEQLLTVLSNIVVDFPEIAQITVNPVVISEGEICAVDARIILDTSVVEGASVHPHLVVSPYPTRYVTPWQLPDGTEVLLRPIRPEDEPLILELLETVSEATLRGRFHSNVAAITHDMLVRLTNIDYDREIAIVAEIGEGEHKRIIGASRLTSEANRPAGEFAVIVHDDFQGRGLGSKLMDIIVGIAQEKHHTEIVGYIDATNHKMMRVAESLGFVTVGVDDGLATVRLTLE
ncbi:MAG TPA: bifunctional acetate--CoA ligase family protein/GNAT family N-acetyltransferase [Coriobacteriia bacterium]|nr:bifunctional acetate--CoA ligase family protein/GNAT family N-acetyltransferase [Coriobacteriia bacterium]